MKTLAWIVMWLAVGAACVIGNLLSARRADSAQTNQTHWLEWNYSPTNGPVSFEIWRSTNLAAFTPPIGTNPPGGFTLWTNVSFPPVMLPTNGPRVAFFIVRARQTMTGPGFGQVSDWGSK